MFLERGEDRTSARDAGLAGTALPPAASDEAAPRALPLRLPAELLVPLARHEVAGLDRDAAALVVAGALRHLRRQDVRGREVLGRLCRALLRRKLYCRLGFSSLSDYARERVGLSGSELRSLARVSERLDGLPGLADAFDRGELSWSKVRLLVEVASAKTERGWITFAGARTVRELRDEVRRRADGGRDGGDAGRAEGAIGEDAAAGGYVGSVAIDSAAEIRAGIVGGPPGVSIGSGSTDSAGAARPGGSRRRRLEALDDEAGRIDREPVVRLSIRCPRRVRSMWRRAVELARRMTGSDGPLWKAAEAMAAEASGEVALPEQLSGVASAGEARSDEERAAGRDPLASLVPGRAQSGIGASTGDASFPSEPFVSGPPDGFEPASRAACRTGDPAPSPRRLAVLSAEELWARAGGYRPGGARQDEVYPWDVWDEAGRKDGSDWPWPGTFDEGAAPFEGLDSGWERLDAFAVDRRIRAVVRTQQQTDWQTGRLLYIVRRLGLHRWLGYSSLGAFVRERLGMSERRARSLLAIDRQGWAVPEIFAAYRSGKLSWLRVLLLRPVVDPRNAAAWVARAAEVTVRRLSDEVEWALDREPRWPRWNPQPPPPGEKLAPPERQTCAPAESEPAGVSISFVGPASVVGFFRDVVTAHRRDVEPLWAGLERMLAVVLAEWESQPPHRDPVFERDGWRCAVPFCSSRSDLHDHHMQFRSRGGGNELSNRLPVCAPHHQYGIHLGVIRVTGTAPDAVSWEIGLAPGARPLMTLQGERYVTGGP